MRTNSMEKQRTPKEALRILDRMTRQAQRKQEAPSRVVVTNPVKERLERPASTIRASTAKERLDA